jgi:hypothetical protein
MAAAGVGAEGYGVCAAGVGAEAYGVFAFWTGSTESQADGLPPAAAAELAAGL